jgi:hypothetical protein
MHWITIILLLAASVLAVSALIISKSPSAKQHIDKLVPYQGFIGVVLLAWGIIDLLRALTGTPSVIDLMRFWALGGAIIFIAILCEVALGFLFGMPLIAKWIPGDTPAEQKALEMQKKVAGFSVLLGIVGFCAAVALILMELGVITPSSMLG